MWSCSFKCVIFKHMLQFLLGAFCLKILSGMPQDLSDDESIINQITVGCRQTIWQYLNQCWPNSMTPDDIPCDKWVHDDVIKWKHFPRHWPFVRGIHRSPVNSPHRGQWRGALMFTLIYARIIGWVNNREAGDLRRYRAHYDVIVMWRRRLK